jgi:hypothetical protein
MRMKHHILAALKEEFSAWEELLGGMSEAQITAPQLPSDMSVKDIIAHLWAWQQRSIARLKAARLDQEPEFPKWPATLDPNSEGDTDQVNAWIYETHHDQPWSSVHQDWSEGFQQCLDLAEGISERDLLDTERYTWLKDYPLVFMLLASYDHHQEHLEKVLAALEGHGNMKNVG